MQDLGAGWSAHGSLSLQHTGNDRLPSSEQFFIGGEGSVRGYPVGTFSGDRGHTAIFELHHPLPAVGGEGQPELAASGYFFLDYGHVTPFRAPNSLQRSFDVLSSIGWGLNASLQKRFTARLAIAFPMNEMPAQLNRYQIYLHLAASLF